MRRARVTRSGSRADKSRGYVMTGGHWGGQQLPPLEPGRVRCPSCLSGAKVTPTGRLYKHKTPGGQPCPFRGHPNVTLPPPDVVAAAFAASDARLPARKPPPLTPPQEPVVKPREARPRLMARGVCHTCGKPVSGERWYCGICFATRKRKSA